MKQWSLKPKIIPEDLVNQPVEGKHSQAKLLDKQSLECLLIFPSEKVIADLPMDVLEKVKHIQLHASLDPLNHFNIEVGSYKEKSYQPICSPYTLSLTPENIRKT